MSNMTHAEKIIHGKKYQAYYWDVETQLDIFARLIKLFGEPLAKVIMGGKLNKETMQDAVTDKPDRMSAIASGIGVLASKINSEDMIYITKKCVEVCHCEGKKLVYATDFMGKTKLLLEISLFVIRHQYADFLDVIPDLSGIGAAQGTTQS